MKVTTDQPKVFGYLAPGNADPLWPEQGAELTSVHSGQLNTHDGWFAAIGPQLADGLKRYYAKDESDLSDEVAFEMDAYAVVSMPDRVVAAARKRIFGDMPPINDQGQWVYSWKELLLIAGAFWRGAHSRDYYVQEHQLGQWRLREALERGRIHLQEQALFSELLSDLE